MNHLNKTIIITTLLLPLHVLCQRIVFNDSLITVLKKGLEKIDTANIDLVSVNDIKLDEVEAKLNEINYRLGRGDIKPSIPNYDNLHKEIGSLNMRVEELRKKINNQNSRLDFLYYKKAQAFEGTDIKSEKKYLEKSLEINPLFIPSLFKLAQLYKDEGWQSFDKSASFATTLLNKTYPDANLQKDILKFGEELFRSFISEAGRLNAGESFSKSGELLAEAKDFCNSNKALNCSDTLEKVIKITKYGIYRSSINIAESALKSGHSDIAENFIFSAMLYKKKNIAYLKDNTDAENLLSGIIDRYLLKAGDAVNAGKYIKAMEYYDKASVLCDSINGDGCNRKIKEGIMGIKNNIYNEFIAKAEQYLDKGYSNIAEDYLHEAGLYRKSNVSEIKDTSFAGYILGKIKFVQYKRLIKEGREYYESGNFENAFRSFSNANELEQRYRLERDAEKDSMMKAVAKPVILRNLRTCDIKIWANELEAAENILTSAGRMQAEYYLLKDPEVIMIISDMKQKLQKKHCENDRDAYDLLLFKAKSCIRSYDYICADKLFSDAVNVVYRHIPCNLNVYEAYESRDKYQPPINYQKLFEEAAYYYQKKNYMQFLKEYYAAESFYTALNIQSWGLKHIPLFDYILRKDDIPLMIAAVAFYTDYNENAPALNMLKLLKSRNFPSEQTKSLQEKLAVKMAKNDRETGKALKPKNNLISYTGKTKWFKYFNRKYRKELKLNIFSNLFGHYKLSRR